MEEEAWPSRHGRVLWGIWRTGSNLVDHPHFLWKMNWVPSIGFPRDCKAKEKLKTMMNRNYVISEHGWFISEVKILEDTKRKKSLQTEFEPTTFGLFGKSNFSPLPNRH